MFVVPSSAGGGAIVTGAPKLARGDLDGEVVLGAAAAEQQLVDEVVDLDREDGHCRVQGSEQYCGYKVRAFVAVSPQH